MTFSTWSQTAASNTAVGGISTDGNITLVNQVDNMFRGMMAELAVARDDTTISATAVRGYLFGLTLSNNAGDATNDIDIAVGEAATSDSPYWKMALASALTKRLDAAWAVGTGNGGLDTGAIGDNFYHMWLIARSDTGVVDVLFSLSATAPTMPTNYDRKRRIGSVQRTAGALIAFTQNGDIFKRLTPAAFYSSASAKASALTAVGVPTGIIVEPIMAYEFSIAVSSNVTVNFGDAAAGSANVQVSSLITGASASTKENNPVMGGFVTNTSGQLYHSVVITAGTISTLNINALGYRDTRGRI